jgi:mevalonate pyrophosphate decarboxylase
MTPIKGHGLIGEVLVAQRRSDEHSMQRLLRLPSGKSARSTYGNIETHEEHYGFAFTLAQMPSGQAKSAQREEPLQNETTTHAH